MEFREQITIGLVYFVFAYFAALGFWQLVAAWQGLRAFSWLRRGVKARWGYLLGSALVGLASLWFFGTRSSEIFSPGPASSEFLFFLGAALVCALATTILLSLVLDRLSASADRRHGREYPRRELVSLKGEHGVLYLPSSRQGPCPAVCMVPEPGQSIESLERVAGPLARDGIVTLIVDMTPEESWLYPDVLILCPTAVAYLESRDDTDASRIGALGVGVAGDLVIRAAASDREIRSLVAVAPLLVESNAQPGLDLLREMSYGEAMRWSGLHRGGELVSRLGALDHVSNLHSRPALIIYGQEDQLAPSAEIEAVNGGAELMLIPGCGRRGLVDDTGTINAITSWFGEHL